MTDRLADLGRRVARISDEQAASDASLDVARDRLFASGARTHTSRSRSIKPWLLASLVALCLCGAAVVAVRMHLTPTAITFAVPDAAADQSNAFIETKQQGTEIRFSEGSLVRVSPESAVRVLATSHRGATLSLERGEVAFAVTHQRETDWTVRAGPFSIHVIGTRFSTVWDPTRGKFVLALEEGRVDVTGPQLTGPHRVSAGEHLAIELKRGDDSRHGAEQLQTAFNEAPTQPKAPVGQSSSASAPSTGETAWQSLARAGKYSDALRAVEGAGFDSVLDRSDATTLHLLADTARLAGAGKQATAALLMLRRKYGARAETAFLLGKIAADQLGTPAEALRWFDTYLDESPSGTLREQALGRSLELDRMRDGRRNPLRARRYLEAYPSGAYAALAREIATTRSP